MSNSHDVVEVLRLEVVEVVAARRPGSRPARSPPGAPPDSPSSTPHSTSRPTTAASTSTFGSTARAAAIAASRSAQSVTLVMPNDEPPRAGFTNTGRPSRSWSAVGQRLPGAQHDVAADRDARGRGELLGELLVHRGGRGEHVRPDVRDAGHLQQALDRAVLAVRAVQHREDHVDVAERAGALGRVEHDQAARGRIAGQHHRRCRSRR